ncbi:hypothetical protein OAV58_01425 [Gammaproteobacteria bacterium]|jgi:hypothetical protein|nr:hypothetical protein [Gammaproteobacteria bacterium]MDA7828767.1 hypothetical protein [Gammaproteobacteria bacterium]MDA9143653.1 hypothetical protein [Gammaproteobacteria bacterium]MDC1123675.1 hypothetical protein [Gammaproteobacteria bacterium]MDC3248332.1 hypothetical protein [Gammaproteobacteria bacterium]
MQYPFIKKDEELKKYLFNLKEVCIIEHEDNWFKEKTHTKLYPNIEDAKAKIGRPHYWILNAIDEYEESDNQEEAMIALAILVFKSNYYSQKLVSSDENLEAKKDLITYLSNLGIEIGKICECISSMDAPAYARVELDKKELSKFVNQFI